jgi:hypothetical protein
MMSKQVDIHVDVDIQFRFSGTVYRDGVMFQVGLFRQVPEEYPNLFSLILSLLANRSAI